MSRKEDATISCPPRGSPSPASLQPTCGELFTTSLPSSAADRALVHLWKPSLLAEAFPQLI